jgi:hypothetical protein
MSYGYGLGLGLGLGLELGLLLRRGYAIGTHRIGIKPRNILLMFAANNCNENTHVKTLCKL